MKMMMMMEMKTTVRSAPDGSDNYDDGDMILSRYAVLNHLLLFLVAAFI